jgi:hypothetical protein
MNLFLLENSSVLPPSRLADLLLASFPTSLRADWSFLQRQTLLLVVDVAQSSAALSSLTHLQNLISPEGILDGFSCRARVSIFRTAKRATLQLRRL